MKELWEYKLDLFFYGIQISKRCHEYLRKDSDGNVTFGDYITTRGLFILLNDTVSVNAMVNETSQYFLDREKNEFILKYADKKVCTITIFQPPEFALNQSTLSNGRLITDLVNLHGDRIRIQPIKGCANKCRFCDLNQQNYYLNSIEDLEEAFLYAKEHVGFRHILISGGSPHKTQEDFDYLSSVYQYFGEKYGDEFPIDVMLVPRGLNVGDNSLESFEHFLKQLKEWHISGIYSNLELYNDFYRKKYIPQKEAVGKENYFKFLKLAVEIFGKENVKSCILIGLEEIEDSLQAVECLSSIGCMPVLSPYITNDNETTFPEPKLMKEVLLKSQEIVEKNKTELGPICDVCKHNTIHFR